ncbi:DUF305 domain-containing protein [Pseudaminobacter sp. 19-2017]|uniref:DUF305 domain-containing protein n=1 Tax=Pseudaminobacter soli (ex Zhang et al. 2022) TaxID=2831468 RepID=A0A942E3B8_9HYPH|nr:DUF305 domain-containing protein [Pseudaminobacter soli]MBS3652363.1 DUF305 domain-containing protein [Pseudaminobacter soli]
MVRQRLLLSKGRTSLLRRALIASALFAAAEALAACSEQPRLLADYLAAICSSSSRSPSAEEDPFLQQNAGAMEKMMTGMSVQPSGDIDRDFVEMMVPHHQGAIEMAQAELRYGHNERLKRMAQEIIVTQQQEIAAMRLALDETLPPATPSPDDLSGTGPAN